MSDNDTQAQLPTVSYGSFSTALDKFHEAGGAPTEFHPSAFHKGTFNGSTIALLVRAFRALNLSNDKNEPNLERVNELIDPKTRKDAFARLLKEHYASLIALPLDKATPAKFNQWFEQFGMHSEDARKAKTFFLHAAKANGITVSKFITDQYKTRTPSSRVKRTPKPRVSGARNNDNDDDFEDEIAEPSIADKLLAKYPDFNPEWSPEVQQKWFDGIAKLQDSLKE